MECGGMSYRFTVLGSGSSGGVPRLGNDWGACDPENSRNRRLRCSALVERFSPRGATTVLIDSGPDIREQLLSVRLSELDGVIYTHDHADHTHGIDDLRVLCYRMRRRIDAWFDEATEESLMTRFGYCFESPPGRSYPPILNARRIEAGRRFEISGDGGAIGIQPVRQAHGEIDSLGFRIGGLAYSPDISGLSDESVETLSGLDVWIVDALRYTPHPSHFTVAQALEWIERLAPKRAILTHLHIDLDYETLRRELPANIEPAYDGMQFHFD
jgi:phosphoribosyl 1,2-cyclic phosphate phosphodiesterase